MPVKELRVLGAVEVDGERVTSAAGASLLAYLAAHGPRPVPREQVAFALWPDRGEDRARRALSDAVYRLRGALPDGAPWLVTAPDEVRLVDVRVDLWSFRERVGAVGADGAGAADVLVDALALHRGPLADGVDDEWLELPRRAHDEAVLAVCEQAAGRLAPRERLTVAERWVELDPYGVESHHCLIETLLALDRRDAARRAIDRYRTVLDELGVVDTDVDRWVALTTDTSPAALPFVGRVAERARLVRALDDACDGHGAIAVVVGEPGIGKSRLLRELADAAGWRGVDVVAAGCDEHLPSRPLAPLDAALARAFDEVRAEQARRRLAPDVVRTLTAIVPHLGATGTSDSTPLDAVTAALGWLASQRAQLLLLDDTHWGGADLWPTLLALGPRLRDHRVLVVVAARTTELLDRGLRRTIGELEGDGAPVVHLTGMSTGEVDQLLRTVGAPDDARAVHDRSGGNPLVALAWSTSREIDQDAPVAGGRELDGRSGAHDVSRVTVAARRRLARLDRVAQRMVQHAAVLGRSVEYGILSAACTDDVGDVFRHVVAAEGVGLLSRRDGRLGFDHDLVRAAMLDGVDHDELRRLHADALRAIEQVQPTDTLRLLGHAEAAGAHVAVVAYSIAAGTDALLQSSYRVAEQHFSRALELAGALDDPLARHAALGGRARARDRLADRAGQGDDVAELLAHAEPVGGSLLEEALVLVAEHRFAVGDLEGALHTIGRAAGADVASWSDDTEVASALGRMAAVTLRELGRYAEAERIGRRVLAQFERAGDEHGAALMTDVVGGIAWRRGDARTAAELHRDAADRFAALGARGAEARALNNVGTALWAIGDDHAAEQVHRRALEVCRSLEDRRGEGDNLDNLGGVSYVRGDYRTAIELYGAALAIRRETDDPWGVSISLSNLGDAHRALGEHARALELIDESITVNLEAGVVRNEATTRQSRGLVLADLGRLDEAFTDLRTAEQMHLALGDRANLLEVRSGILDVLMASTGRAAPEVPDEADTRGGPHGVDDLARAAAALAADVADDDPPRSREIAHLALARAADAGGDTVGRRRHAARAAIALDEALAGLTPADAALRRVAVPLHRAVGALVERDSRFVEVRLSRHADAEPYGNGADPTVTLRWTVERPDDEFVGEPPARRRHVLARLLREAAAAGAAPTDDDLAAALLVSRRTVLRDVDVLRDAGLDVRTRGRSSASGAAPNRG